MKLIRVIKAEKILRWGIISRREIAEVVAKNFTKITKVDINDLFTKVDDQYGTTIENVNAPLFDAQIPKIYKWVKSRFELDKDDYDYMINDSDFIDMITDELVNMVDIDKVKYDKQEY